MFARYQSQQSTCVLHAIVFVAVAADARVCLLPAPPAVLAQKVVGWMGKNVFDRICLPNTGQRPEQAETFPC